MSSTTPFMLNAARGVAFTVPLTILVAVGTGAPPSRYCAQGTGGSLNEYNLRRNVPFFGCSSADIIEDDTPISNAAEDIGCIKNNLRLTTTELARCLGVSRQAIYDWQSGAHIKSHNISKLENLKSAADVISAANLPISALQLGRKLPGGSTLLESISAGSNGHDAAQALVNMLKRDARNRKDLTARFAGRKPVANTSIGDGIAALRESG